MAFRELCWALGFGLGIVAAIALPESEPTVLRPLAFGVAFVGLGIVGEVVDYRNRRKRRRSAAWPSDRRSADLTVDLAVLRGARSVPNPIDSRFGRFLGLDEEVSRSPRRGGLSDLDPDGRDSPPLLGRVALASLYLGADGTTWSSEEIVASLESLFRAGRWLEREALAWKVPVNVELLSTYFEVEGDADETVAIGYQAEGEDVGPMERDADLKALYAVTKAARKLGFDDAYAMAREVEERIEADSVIWLVHLRRRGRSHALPREHTWSSGLPGLSLAICYARESSFPEPLDGAGRTDPVTVVHESLHLFGATDKYGRSLRSYAPRAVTGREVMRLSESRLSRLRIDLQTAKEIGWVDARAPKTPKAGPGEGRPVRPLG